MQTNGYSSNSTHQYMDYHKQLTDLNLSINKSVAICTHIIWLEE